MDKKSAKPAQAPKVTQAPKAAQALKVARSSRPVPSRREVFGPAIPLASPEKFLRSAAKVFGKPAAAPIKAEVVIKNEAPVSVKEEAVAPIKQETVVRVKEEVISDTKSFTSSTPELAPVKGLESSRYVTDEYKAAHAALAKSTMIADAAKAKASIHSSASQLHGTATVKPVVNLPKEDEYNHDLTRKWGGQFSMDDGPVQDATIIYFAKDSSGPRILRLVVTIDGKPVSVFSQVVPKDVAVKREDGTSVLLGPFVEKGAECCNLRLQTDRPVHMEAIYNIVTLDPYRPAESRVEPEVIGNQPETEAPSQVAEVTSIDMSTDNANQDGEQAEIPKIFDSCFEHDGVAFLFAGAVEFQYEGTFLEYLFKTFNNSTLQPDDAKEAILESVELVAGAEQMLQEFTRSSPTFNMMLGIGATGPPRGFGKKVLAELLAVRDAHNSRKVQVSSPNVEQPASNVELPAMQDEPSPNRTTYAEGDLFELRTNAVQYEKELLPSKEMRSSKEMPSEEVISGRARQQSTPKPLVSSDTAPAPSTSVAGWNTFATTAGSLPVSSPIRAAVPLPTPDTVPAPSKPVSFTVPDPPSSQVKGGNVFPHNPSRNANQTSKSLAPVGNLTRGPMPSSMSNNQVLDVSPSGMPDTVLGKVIASSIVKKEDLEDAKTVSENIDAKLAKLPKLGASRFGPMGDKGGNLEPTANRPMPFQPKALTSSDDKLKKQLQPTANRPMASQPNALPSSELKEQLELARQLQGEVFTGGKTKTSRAAPSNPSAYSVPKQAQRNAQKQMSGQVANGGFPQQQPFPSFPPREDMHARKESTDSSDTDHKSRGPRNGNVKANTNVNAHVFSQRQALQAQYRANLQPRR